jgi:hypothetical protein
MKYPADTAIEKYYTGITSNGSHYEANLFLPKEYSAESLKEMEIQFDNFYFLLQFLSLPPFKNDRWRLLKWLT